MWSGRSVPRRVRRLSGRWRGQFGGGDDGFLAAFAGNPEGTVAAFGAERFDVGTADGEQAEMAGAARGGELAQVTVLASRVTPETQREPG